jgi:MFS family permease
MSKPYIKIVRDVFSSRNILTIAITTSMMDICMSGWRPFWGLYLTNELGATIGALGLMSTIQLSERLLFQLPGGIFTDRFGRRKIIVYGTALRIIPPIIYLWATNWVQIIPALLVNGAASIYMPAFNAIIADSLPKDERGAGYGAYRMITSTPQIFAPIIGGVLMDRLGYQEGVRIFFYISIVVNTVVTITRYKIITETLFDEDEEKSKIISNKRVKRPKFQISETFNIGKTVWLMVVVSVLSNFGMRMVWDFMSIYAVEYVGLTNTQLGLVSTMGGVITVFLAMPGGMLSDRIGRKPLITFSRLLTPLSFFAVTLVNNYPQYFFTQAIRSFADSLGGGGGYSGGPAWQALVADLVPKEKRGTVMGTIGTVTGLVSAPASMLGSFLWESIAPSSPFIGASIIGLIGVTLFFFGVHEPNTS